MAEAAAPSEIFGDPFKWEPQPVAPFDFEIQDGVFRVFDRSGAEPFQLPGNSFDFFSDMSRSVLTCSSNIEHLSLRLARIKSHCL